MNKIFIIFAIGALGLALVIIAGIRLVSPEDAWICRDGQWSRHGNPSNNMPVAPCK